MRSHLAADGGISVWRGDDVAGVGETTNQPWDLVGDFRIGDQGYSEGVGKDDVYWFNKAAFAQPAGGTFGDAGRNIIEGPHQVSWDVALLKNFLGYVGVEADRTTFTWVSASEGERFAQVIRGVTEKVRAWGPAAKLVKRVAEPVATVL